MVWLCACSKGITPLVILDEGTVDHTVYIKKVLPVALKYGMKLLVAIESFNRMAPSHARIIFRHNNDVETIFHDFMTMIIGLEIVPI